jgi:CBS domain-containing protein
VEFKKIVGIISKTDLLYFVKGAKKLSKQDELRNNMWLSHYQVEDMMTSQLATLEPEDSVRTALAVFQKNLFRALPIVRGEELLGMITTHDILNFFAQETIQLSDYKTVS